jgi:hypothetical protein
MRTFRNGVAQRNTSVLVQASLVSKENTDTV